jgi:solute carrier family 25 folate transporter 32
MGGFTSGIATCPLDVIKTKLQAQASSPVGRHVDRPKVYEGLVGTARVIWREEGIRGMYRGLGPITLGYLPTWAVWFTVYNKSKVWMGQYHGRDLPFLRDISLLIIVAYEGRGQAQRKRTDLPADNIFMVNFWSSIIAGASSTIATNPIWVIKTRLMSQSYHHGRHQIPLYPRGANTPTSRPSSQAPLHYRSTLDAARKMYTTEGIASFYSGLAPALLGLTHVAVQFPAYEYLKTKFTGRGMGASPEEGGDTKPHWFGVLSASILSKILASSATYPHEVIRTRLQTQQRPVAGQEFLESFSVPAGHETNTGDTATRRQQKKQEHQQPARRRRLPKYRGIIMTFRTILREEGWRAFYAGMGTNMMRAVPAATVTMLTYEYVMRELNQTRINGRRKLELRGTSAVAI